MIDEEFNLYNTTFEELYNKMIEIIENEDENGETIKNIEHVKNKLSVIRYGENMRIPWICFIENKNLTVDEPYDLYKKIYVKGYGEQELIKYHLERDNRMSLMRSIIKEYDTDEPITKIRERKERRG